MAFLSLPSHSLADRRERRLIEQLFVARLQVAGRQALEKALQPSARDAERHGGVVHAYGRLHRVSACVTEAGREIMV